jgi:uncharacterized protein (TIGR03067 family)
MRRTVCLLAVLLVVPSLGSDEPRGYEGQVTWDDGLQGAWRLVTFETPTLRINHENADPDILTFRAGKWERSSVQISEAGTYTPSTGFAPARLDRTYTAGAYTGSTEKLIYCIDGDRLRIAARFKEGVRPGSFAEEALYIYTYQRMK